MRRRLSILFAFALLAATVVATADDSPPRPNLVVILCDDLGWGDLGCYGHPLIRTPHLDRLAADGVRFTDFYSAAPVCSPARVGLLTGRTPNRAGVYDWIPEAGKNPQRWGPRAVVQMREQEFTVAELLKSAGYATCMSGKWHCNARFNSPAQAQPDDQGFDHWFATQNNASPSHENPVNFVRNGEPVGPIEGFSCEIVVGEAVAWLRRHHGAQPEQPFFVYLAFHEPHEPVASPPERVAFYENAGARNHDEAQYFANVENLDAATGTLLAALDDLGYRDDTLVIFTSDNGPETLNRYRSANRSYGRPGPLRGMKLHTHEAGFRVAGIARWPECVAPGQVSTTPVCSLDFLPTFAALSGGRLPPELHLDGTDVRPALHGDPVDRAQPLIWVYYNALNEAVVAMRQGDWKILGQLVRGQQRLPNYEHVNRASADAVRAAVLDRFELYNLRRDPSESHNLSEAPEGMIDRFRELYRDVLDESHVWP